MIGFKRAIELRKEMHAYKLAWNSLTEEQKNMFTKIASEEVDKDLAETFKKELNKAEAVFNDPNFVSRASDKY